MYRWTARLLLAVVTLSAFGPMALAAMSSAHGAHCLRQPEKPAVMPCHHEMMAMAEAQSPSTSLHATDNCCENHDCCIRGITTRQWASPESFQLADFYLPVVRVTVVSHASLVLAGDLRKQSARAPPRIS
jgi:hypothetical protein